MSGNTSATGGYIPGIPPPPPGGTQIGAALQKAIVALTGLPGNLVRPRYQPTPPSQPPATTTWAAVGVSAYEADDDYPYIRHDSNIILPGAPGPGADIMERHLTLRVLVTIYGPDPDVIAGMIRDGFYVQQNWEPLHRLGLRLLTVRDLSWTPEMVNQQWIDRFDLEMMIRQQVIRVYPVLNIIAANALIKSQGVVPDQDVPITEGPVATPYR